MELLSLSGRETMSFILEAAPGAKRALFSHFHIGGCQSCAYSMEDSLEEVCQKNELELAAVIDVLQDSHEHDQAMLISPESLQTALKDSPLVLDLRTREEFEAVPFPQALLCTQDKQQEIFAKHPEETVIYFIDHLGKDVLDRCSWFRGHGFKNTWGLQGGIDLWAQKVDSQFPRYKLELS